MEALQVGGRVETVELRDLQAFQPCDVQVLHDVMRREVAGSDRDYLRIWWQERLRAAQDLASRIVLPQMHEA